MASREQLYRQVLLIRRFEERVLDLFSRGSLSGTTHASIGQEAHTVAVMAHLGEDDIVVSNHRCHGHYIARTGDIEGLLAELMGKSGGVCGGWGGSQHIHSRNFYANGVLGSTIPIAAGLAFSQRKKHPQSITVVFMGDGAFGQGCVYETFNLISLWQVPLLVLVENNGYAQTTPIALNFAGTFSGRAKAFDIDFGESESTDAEELMIRLEKVVHQVRSTGLPRVEVVHTYRLCGHSKGDDFRPTEEIVRWQQRDPLEVLGIGLESEIRANIEASVCKQLDEAQSRAEAMPAPKL